MAFLVSFKSILEHTQCITRFFPPDIEVVECVLRPYEVKAHTLMLLEVGLKGKEMIGTPKPSLGPTSLWTAQAVNKIPGHTGYLTIATIHYKLTNSNKSC